MAFTYPVTIINSNINVNQTTSPASSRVKTYDISPQIQTSTDNVFQVSTNPDKDTFSVILDGMYLALNKDYVWLNETQFKIFDGLPAISSNSTLIIMYADL